MSRQLEVLRVINSDQRPLSQRGSEWVLKDCEGQFGRTVRALIHTHIVLIHQHSAPGACIGDIS